MQVEAPNLEGADLTGAYLVGADLRRANLKRADLTLADLRGADLEGACLEGTNFRLASYSSKTRWPAGFRPELHGPRLVVDPPAGPRWWKRFWNRES